MHQRMIVPTYIIVINVLSILCGLSMMALVSWLRRRKPDTTDTASFKLSFWIGLVNALWSTHFLLKSSGDILYSMAETDAWWIRMLAWLSCLFYVWDTALSACVAFNLQLSFIHHRTNLKRIQAWYAPGSFLFSICVTFPWLIKPTCFNKAGNAFQSELSKEEFVLFYLFFKDLWVGIGILYSTAVIVLVLFHVAREARRLRELKNDMLYAKELKFTQSVVWILLYPAVLIVTHTFGIIKDFSIRNYDWDTRSTLRMVDKTMISSVGILNFIVFLLNPAFRRSLDNIPWLSKFLRLSSPNTHVPTSNGIDRSVSRREPIASEFHSKAWQDFFLEIERQVNSDPALAKPQP
ncbi:uncharacterized protein VTP21DRAFT_7670 [Calcarisporiella thermophila]|uniref:uncharacterized protein n=1 Tax=Calcarisporiella thermophila TaxID=911321 RepID=UPI0037424719